MSVKSTRIMMFGSHDAIMMHEYKSLLYFICELIENDSSEGVWDNFHTGILKVLITGSIWKTFSVDIKDLRHQLYIRHIGRIPFFIEIEFDNGMHIGVCIKYIGRSEKPFVSDNNELTITVEAPPENAPDEDYIFA